MGLAARDLAEMGAQVETIPGCMGFGDCLRASLPHARAGEPGILVMGHMDTVHPVGTLEALPWRLEGTRAYGPGILDMKGGNYAALEAVRHCHVKRISCSLLLGGQRPPYAMSTT